MAKEQAKKGQKEGSKRQTQKWYNKPIDVNNERAGKVFGYVCIGIIVLVVWGLINAVTSGMSRSVDINGKTVKVDCSSYCSTLEKYGDADIIKTLASVGITKITFAPYELEDSKAKITTETVGNNWDTDDVVIEFSGKKVSKIYNEHFPEIIYYSTNTEDTTYQYPSADILAQRRNQQEAAEKAAEEQRKAEEALVPSAEGTADLCEKQFHQNYPWNGSKVHSILGVVTNSKYSADSRLYKVSVTIANAYGASYDAVMECVVQKSGDYIKITTFNVY